MTDHTQARAEGRAEGIREAAEFVAQLPEVNGKRIATAILALLDTPAPTQPAPAEVTVENDDPIERMTEMEAQKKQWRSEAPAGVTVPDVVQSLTWIIENTSQVRVRDQALSVHRALSGDRT